MTPSNIREQRVRHFIAYCLDDTGGPNVLGFQAWPPTQLETFILLPDDAIAQGREDMAKQIQLIAELTRGL